MNACEFVISGAKQREAPRMWGLASKTALSLGLGNLTEGRQ